MDRETSAPEDLPPLELRELRDLEVERDEGDERPRYIARPRGSCGAATTPT